MSAQTSLRTIDAAMQPFPELEKSLTRTSDATGAYINGPLTFATDNAGQLEDTTNTAIGHFDARFLAPYNGKHPRWHTALSVGKGLIGAASTGIYMGVK